MSARSSAVIAAGLFLLLSSSICRHASGTSQQDVGRDSAASSENQSHYTRDNRASDKLSHMSDDAGIFAPLAGRQLNEMPEFKPGFNEDDELLLEIGHILQHNQESLHQQHNISDATLMALIATSQIRSFSEMYLHRYDNYNDMRLATGPGVDQDRCVSQLENLAARADLQAREQYSSKDVNLYQLMDTWGHFPCGFLRGNSFVAGMYQECAKMKIELPSGERAPTRYCTVSIRHSHWPRIDRFDVLNVMAGVCIPKACDSSVDEKKVELLMRLVEHQFRQLERGQMEFHSLYCLPDEDSPLRSLLNSPKAMITLAFLAGWLSLLVYCTYMHHKLASDQSNRNRLTKADETMARKSMGIDIFKNLSITHNAKLLFSTDRTTSAIKRDASGEEAEPEKIVDFSCIDGIKVIAMVYVIMGHVLMCLAVTNAREPSGKTSSLYYAANMQPNFAVNVFFTVTGVITCYTVFKQNRTHEFITSPIKWTAFACLRYIRIMPMYVLVVLYSKTLAKYTSSGPLWDYATSSLSQRRSCEQEPWSDTLLFKSNLKPPLALCIPGAWYLANDFQFLLLTPLLMALLYKRPALGQALLYAGTAAGMAVAFWAVISSNVTDIRPIAAFDPQGFKTFVSLFSPVYTRPQYRIPAYLIGLLAGYELYRFERAKVEFLEAKRRRQVDGHGAAGGQRAELAPALQEQSWPEGIRKYAIPMSLLIVTACHVTQAIASELPFNKFGAQFAVASIMSTYHILVAIATALYLLPSSTGYGYARLSSFFAAGFWKPLVRLSLCAMLVNVEVINYIVLSSPVLPYYSNGFHLTMNLVCIMTTYAVSAVAFILFEAPIRAVLSSALAKTIDRASNRIKTKEDIKTS